VTASSADLHNQIATQYAPADALPCADFALLVPLKKSPEYRTIRPRIANPKAIDSWQEEGLHFFIFELKPANGAAVDPSKTPVAVFTMHPEEPAPISVVVVTPSTSGAEAEVEDLRQPERAYMAPYFGDDHALQPNHNDTAGQVNQDLTSTRFDDDPLEVERPQVTTAPSPDLDRDEQLQSDDPCLVHLKKSPEYQVLSPYVVTSHVNDAWQEDGLQFFSFELRAVEGIAEPPTAVFAMQPEETVPFSVVVVIPSPDGREPEVLDLQQFERAYSTPLPP
jgi:hypothetical protein